MIVGKLIERDSEYEFIPLDVESDIEYDNYFVVNFREIPSVVIEDFENQYIVSLKNVVNRKLKLDFRLTNVTTEDKTKSLKSYLYDCSILPSLVYFFEHIEGEVIKLLSESDEINLVLETPIIGINEIETFFFVQKLMYNLKRVNNVYELNLVY